LGNDIRGVEADRPGGGRNWSSPQVSASLIVARWWAGGRGGWLLGLASPRHRGSGDRRGLRTVALRRRAFAGQLLAEALRAQGIKVYTNSRLTGVAREHGDGPIRARLEDGSELVADELLIAAGRRPRTTEIGVEFLGLEADRPLPTDPQLRVVGVEGGWLYAIGDVSGHAALTHMGPSTRRGLPWSRSSSSDRRAIADESVVPGGRFHRPRGCLGRIDRSHSTGPGLFGATSVARSRASPQRQFGERGLTGRCPAGHRRGTGSHTRATFVGSDTGELLHGATIAIAGESRWSAFATRLPAFPTLSEVWLELLDAYRSQHRVSYKSQVGAEARWIPGYALAATALGASTLPEPAWLRPRLRR